ncbi:MAG: Gfo/Idh/MocA family oxidoreductase [Phycisphaerae bacterium]|nr:Gfo/Idh/MocA family oxidoreductase [Phycisphaerae bacterium]MCZ2399054.1 Gfo/Idh/MocA family oxidoreductase [Phycisphaerae bacterium]
MSRKPTDHESDAFRIAGLSRRDFLRRSALASTALLATGCASTTHRRGAARPGSPEEETRAPAIVGRAVQPLRVGVIGCGGRGTGAAIDCVKSSEQVSIVALGDLFADRVASSRAQLEKSELGEALQVTDERCFSGFENYKGVLSCDVDLVILAAPPGFRPPHLKAAIAAGKHVFMEKPVAVDPVGVRSIIASSDLAREKGLAIVAGTQRRHDPAYVETIRRIHDGHIGRIVAAQCYWNQGELWVHERKSEYSDMEWQCRNWLYFDWLSGDHIVEQHIHNLDVINWAIGSPPVRCVGMGGRQVRTGPEYGNIYDHFSVEYEYPDGVRVLSMCRQIKGSSDRVAERLVGTKGVSDPNGRIEGPRHYLYEPAGEAVNPYEQEHRHLVESIRRGRPLNEGRRVAESTLTAIMGRMSAYTGREISWDWIMNASKLDLSPAAYAFGDLPVRAVPTPGVTELV